jgi:hypothetical protein
LIDLHPLVVLLVKLILKIFPDRLNRAQQLFLFLFLLLSHGTLPRLVVAHLCDSIDLMLLLLIHHGCQLSGCFLILHKLLQE